MPVCLEYPRRGLVKTNGQKITQAQGLCTFCTWGAENQSLSLGPHLEIVSPGCVISFLEPQSLSENRNHLNYFLELLFLLKNMK